MKSFYIILASSIPFIVSLLMGFISWIFLYQRTIPTDILLAVIFYLIPPYVFIILPFYFGIKYLIERIFNSLRSGVFLVSCVLVAFLQAFILVLILGGSLFDKNGALVIGLPFLLLGFSFALLVLFFEKKPRKTST